MMTPHPPPSPKTFRHDDDGEEEGGETAVYLSTFIILTTGMWGRIQVSSSSPPPQGGVGREAERRGRAPPPRLPQLGPLPPENWPGEAAGSGRTVTPGQKSTSTMTFGLALSFYFIACDAFRLFVVVTGTKTYYMTTGTGSIIQDGSYKTICPGQ